MFIVNIKNSVSSTFTSSEALLFNGIYVYFIILTGMLKMLSKNLSFIKFCRLFFNTPKLCHNFLKIVILEQKGQHASNFSVSVRLLHAGFLFGLIWKILTATYRCLQVCPRLVYLISSHRSMKAGHCCIYSSIYS